MVVGNANPEDKMSTISSLSIEEVTRLFEVRQDPIPRPGRAAAEKAAPSIIVIRRAPNTLHAVERRTAASDTCYDDGRFPVFQLPVWSRGNVVNPPRLGVP